MNLKEHLEVLGWSPDHLAFLTKVDKAVITRAIAGQPITQRHANKICDKIGHEFGHHSTPANGQPPYSINGLVTVGK